MPLYDFICNACNKKQERLVKTSETTPKECLECGQGPLEKQIPTGTGYVLKGSGWYASDNKTKTTEDS